eukprot:Rhum_TRINITY_DN14097_c1_g1::Rhum_TRINITY_DN14097_c1_g1_i1::g.67018::m.67018
MRGCLFPPTPTPAHHDIQMHSRSFPPPSSRPHTTHHGRPKRQKKRLPFVILIQKPKLKPTTRERHQQRRGKGGGGAARRGGREREMDTESDLSPAPPPQEPSPPPRHLSFAESLSCPLYYERAPNAPCLGCVSSETLTHRRRVGAACRRCGGAPRVQILAATDRPGHLLGEARTQGAVRQAACDDTQEDAEEVPPEGAAAQEDAHAGERKAREGEEGEGDDHVPVDALVLRTPHARCRAGHARLRNHDDREDEERRREHVEAAADPHEDLLVAGGKEALPTDVQQQKSGTDAILNFSDAHCLTILPLGIPFSLSPVIYRDSLPPMKYRYCSF